MCTNDDHKVLANLLVMVLGMSYLRLLSDCLAIVSRLHRIASDPTTSRKTYMVRTFTIWMLACFLCLVVGDLAAFGLELWRVFRTLLLEVITLLTFILQAKFFLLDKESSGESPSHAGSLVELTQPAVREHWLVFLN